jgi:hypothetical protein
MASGAGAASAASGQTSTANASERTMEGARTRIRKLLNDILYSGALTNRQSDTQQNRRPTRQI